MPGTGGNPMQDTTSRADAPSSRPRFLGQCVALFALVAVLASCAYSGPSPSDPSSRAATATGPAPATTSQEAAPTASPVTAASAAPSVAVQAPSGSTAAAAPTVTPVPGPGSAFTLLKMATGAARGKPAPDATTFTSTFPAKAPAMYVVFALRTGLTGDVVCAITANGVQSVKPITLAYGASNSWGDFKISSRGTFVMGDYRATLTFGPTGEVATIAFTVK